MSLQKLAGKLWLGALFWIAPPSPAQNQPAPPAFDAPLAPFYSPAADHVDVSLTVVSAPLRVYSHPEEVLAVGFSPDGRVLAAGDGGGKVWLWPIGSEELVRTLEAHRKGVRALAYNPDGATIATGGGDGSVRVWDLKDLKPQSWLDARHRGPVTALSFGARGGEIISSSEDDSIWVRDVITNKKLTTYFGHSADVSGLGVDPEGRCIVSGAEDRSVQAWSLKTGEQVDFSTQNAKVLAVALSADGKRLATATSDGIVAVRRTDGCTVHTVALRLDHHSGPVRTLAFSPNGRWLYSAGDDRSVVKWDLESGLPVETFEGHQEPVVALAVSPDGALLASGGRDRTVRIWKQGETSAFSRNTRPSPPRTASKPGHP